MSLQDEEVKNNKETETDTETDEKPERDFMALILTLVVFIKELMERRALKMMESDKLTKSQVQNLEQFVENMKDDYELDDNELNIDLGDLGKLR